VLQNVTVCRGLKDKKENPAFSTKAGFGRVWGFSALAREEGAITTPKIACYTME